MTDTKTSQTVGIFKSPKRVSESKPNLMNQNYISICFTKNCILCGVILLSFTTIKKIHNSGLQIAQKFAEIEIYNIHAAGTTMIKVRGLLDIKDSYRKRHETASR